MGERVKRFPVVEIFGPTIQGEGSMCGVQTYFIRFGGCDYRCKMCDSMHAVDPSSVKALSTYMTAEEIVQKMDDIMGHHEWITLSGGNPAMHDIADVVIGLKSIGKKVAVETQGSLFQEWIHMCDTVTISPKGPGMGEACDFDKLDGFMMMLSQHIDVSLKVVIFDQRDIEFAVLIAERYPTVQLYLSLGNPNPPKLDGFEDFSQDQLDRDRDMISELLARYNSLGEDIMQDPRLTNAIFLPQLHVLVWGNARSK